MWLLCTCFFFFGEELELQRCRRKEVSSSVIFCLQGSDLKFEGKLKKYFNPKIHSGNLSSGTRPFIFGRFFYHFAQFWSSMVSPPSFPLILKIPLQSILVRCYPSIKIFFTYPSYQNIFVHQFWLWEAMTTLFKLTQYQNKKVARYISANHETIELFT